MGICTIFIVEEYFSIFSIIPWIPVPIEYWTREVREMTRENPVLIYCKLEEATISGDGNIYIIVSKDRKSTAEESVQRLKLLIGKNCSMIVSEMSK